MRYGVAFDTIAVANGLEPPYRIRPGQRLIIPAVISAPVVPRHGEITGLTSLISTGAQAGVLLYSRTIQNKSLTFAMRLCLSIIACAVPDYGNG